MVDAGAGRRTGFEIDLWLRRIHMYAALFLLPWVLMYAISAAVMNHSEHLGGPPPEPAFEKVLERPYQGTLPDGATPEQIAIQLLDELGMPGRHRARIEPGSGAVVITRDSPSALRRITYRPSGRMITVEEGSYGARRFLSQLHRRRGIGTGSLKEDAWGLSVDAFVAAMLVWILSGLWMWWQVKSTWRSGWLSLGSGIALFVLFLLTI
jgi:hypothetical protein